MFLETPEGLHTVKAAYLDAGFSFFVVFLFQFWVFFPLLWLSYMWTMPSLAGSDFNCRLWANNNSQPFCLSGKVCEVSAMAFLALLRSRG